MKSERPRAHPRWFQTEGGRLCLKKMCRIFSIVKTAWLGLIFGTRHLYQNSSAKHFADFRFSGSAVNYGAFRKISRYEISQKYLVLEHFWSGVARNPCPKNDNRNKTSTKLQFSRILVSINIQWTKYELLRGSTDHRTIR